LSRANGGGEDALEARVEGQERAKPAKYLLRNDRISVDLALHQVPEGVRVG
jgi:hypothetical protein